MVFLGGGRGESEPAGQRRRSLLLTVTAVNLDRKAITGRTRKKRATLVVVVRSSLAGVVGAALLLSSAAILASLMPAARASRVDVLQALRSE